MLPFVGDLLWLWSGQKFQLTLEGSEDDSAIDEFSITALLSTPAVPFSTSMHLNGW